MDEGFDMGDTDTSADIDVVDSSDVDIDIDSSLTENIDCDSNDDLVDLDIDAPDIDFEPIIEISNEESLLMDDLINEANTMDLQEDNTWEDAMCEDEITELQSQLETLDMNPFEEENCDAANVSDNMEAEPIEAPHENTSSFEAWLETASRDDLLDTKQALEELRELENETGDSFINEETLEDNDKPKTLTRDSGELSETGYSAIEDNLEAIRDDYRDKGWSDGHEMEALIQAERENLQQEFEHDAFHYGEDREPIDSLSGNTESISEDNIEMLISEQEMSELQEEVDTLDIKPLEVTEAVAESEGSQYPSEAEQVLPTDLETLEADNDIADKPEQKEVELELDDEIATEDQEIVIDYETVYEGLDQYDFDGKDYNQNSEQLTDLLNGFTERNWSNLNSERQKDQIEGLSSYINDVLGFENPPNVEYYYKPEEGNYGGYNPTTNTLEINEYMMNDAKEAADTVAHESWHAYQHQCAEKPRSGGKGSIDHQRQYGLNNYIRPYYDETGKCVNFEDYQDQLVESEARAFADQFKGRLAEITRRNT